MVKNSFTRKGRDFHRLVNGKIIQAVSYYSFAFSREFTIQFAILPLCLGAECSAPLVSIHRICSHEDFTGEVAPWHYEGSEGYMECMPTALKATEELLLPKMDREINYENYYSNYLRSKAFTLGWDKISFQRYIFALIFENYADAEKTMDKNIKNWRETNIENFGTEYHIAPEMQEKFERRCIDYYHIKKAMDKGDRKSIEEYISSLEQKSLQSYVKAYSTSKKYEKYLETGVLPFEVVNI